MRPAAFDSGAGSPHSLFPRRGKKLPTYLIGLIQREAFDKIRIGDERNSQCRHISFAFGKRSISFDEGVTAVGDIYMPFQILCSISKSNSGPAMPGFSPPISVTQVGEAETVELFSHVAESGFQGWRRACC
ncbi:hypothetical protein [Candidatus Methylospira mobilis]|uniref:hypothetical protein n=1 Tax=Candidatus Methylospira mobilis TaxID=1808979 RepID=UPI001D171B33|nr:hypothetical protein [Candidatus Methylospira mobilis]